MATIDLGRLGFVNKGTYNNSTTYEKNDLVQFTDGGILSTYLYIDSTAQSGQAPSSSGTAGSRWVYFAKGVADAVASAGNNKVLVTDGSGSLSPVAIGSAGQVLKTNSGANGFEFGTISSGNYSVHAFDVYSYSTDTNHNGQTHYVDIAGGNTVSFTPTHVNDVIFFQHGCNVNSGNTQGSDVFLNMGTSSTLGSSNTKLNYTGSHAHYHNTLNDFYNVHTKSFQLTCTGLSVGTAYYVEQAGAVHTANQVVGFNTSPVGNSGSQNIHWVGLTHYKYNA